MSKQTNELIKKIEVLAIELRTDELESIVRQMEILVHNKNIAVQMKKRRSERKEALKNQKENEDENINVNIIESEDGKSFRLFVGRYPKMFMLDEMRKMVKLCHSSNDPNECAKKLHVWINNNRKDFFMDVQVDDKVGVFKNIYEYLVGNYAVKQ